MEDSRTRVRVPAGLRIIHCIVHLVVINWDGRHFPAFSSMGSLAPLDDYERVMVEALAGDNGGGG